MDIKVLTATNTERASDFGGTPGFLIKSLEDLGADASGMDLSPSLLDRLRRAKWVAVSSARQRRIARGWVWSEAAQRLRDKKFAKLSERTTVYVSLTQNPPRPALERGLVMYLDATLEQLRDGYPEYELISKQDFDSARDREKNAYENALRVFVKTTQAKNSLVDSYGLEASKVSVLPPPPNLGKTADASIALLDPAGDRANGGEVKFLAIAKEYERKGVDRAIQLVSNCRDLGLDATLTIAGLTPGDLPGWTREAPWIEALGHIDKTSNPKSYGELLGTHHCGLLLSRGEAAGLAFSEYQAAGLIAIGSGVGGMKSVGFSRHCYWVDSLDDAALLEFAREIQNWIAKGELQRMLKECRDDQKLVPTWPEVARTLLNVLAREAS